MLELFSLGSGGGFSGSSSALSGAPVSNSFQTGDINIGAGSSLGGTITSITPVMALMILGVVYILKKGGL